MAHSGRSTMKRILFAVLVSLVVPVTQWALVTAQQPPACLHGPNETAADAGRRMDALRVVRAINSAQAQTFRASQAYANFQTLTTAGLPSRPAGFAAQLTVEGSAYTIVLRDAVDPCRYTLFSDQDGVIYVASPLS
jgi:hypothetical protein